MGTRILVVVASLWLVVASLWLAACGSEPVSTDADATGSSATVNGSSDSQTSTTNQSTTAAESTTEITTGTAATSSTSLTTAAEDDDCTKMGCGELQVCSCECDIIPTCCGCKQVQCTADEHCPAGDQCLYHGDDDGTDRVCGPPLCAGSNILSHYIYSDSMLANLGEVICAYKIWLTGDITTLTALAPLTYVHFELEVIGTQATSLAGLENLSDVGDLVIRDNVDLTDISALAGLKTIRFGGKIDRNVNLPTAEIEALLAEIEGGDSVIVCGNLDGLPC